eukprot:887217-Rhodomonas_salina.3
MPLGSGGYGATHSKARSIRDRTGEATPHGLQPHSPQHYDPPQRCDPPIPPLRPPTSEACDRARGEAV